MQKIVINSCYGGFNLSYDGVMEYAKNKKIKLYAYVYEGSIRKENIREYNPQKNDNKLIHYSKMPLKRGKTDDKHYFSDRDIERDDPALVKTVKKLGEKANGYCAKLKIVEIPDGVKWEIDEYDGLEHIQEQCQRWS